VLGVCREANELGENFASPRGQRRHTQAKSTNENRAAVRRGGRKCLVLQKDSSTSVALLTLDFP
jgi:hypothetical protein